MVVKAVGIEKTLIISRWLLEPTLRGFAMLVKGCLNRNRATRVVKIKSKMKIGQEFINDLVN